MSEAGSAHRPETPPARSRLRGRALAFTAALYLAWISAGHLPLREALSGVLTPTDFTRDFIAAKVLRRGESISRLDGQRGNVEAVRAGAKPVAILDSSVFHLHPPPAALPILPFTLLGFRAASLAWLGLSLALLWALAGLLAPLLASSRIRVRAPLLFALLLFWPPVLTNLELGQWSILLAVLVAGGHRLWERDRRRWGAAAWGVAAALKLTPLVLLPFVALRDRRASLVLMAVVVGACVAAFPLGHFDPWVAFLRHSGPNVAGWQTFWHNTLSLNGLCARLLVGGLFATPLLRAPGVARALVIASSMGLVASALALTGGGRPATARDRNTEGCRFSLWVVLIVVLNPLAWYHYALLLLLPAGLVMRAAHDQRVAPDERRRLCAVVAAAVVALSVPKETLYLIVQPLPASPLGSLLLSLHLYAALALFGAAAFAARAGARSGGA